MKKILSLLVCLLPLSLFADDSADEGGNSSAPFTINYESTDSLIVEPLSSAFLDKDGNVVSLISNEYIDGVGTLTFASEVAEIGEKAFADNMTLRKINIPAPITSIGRKAFSTCRRLKYVTLPSSLTSIGYASFEECNTLVSVNLPRELTKIGDYAFMQCIALYYVDLPHNTTEIGQYAYYGCTSLQRIYPSSVPPTIYKNTFSPSTYSDCTLYVHNGLYSLYSNADYWKEFLHIVEFSMVPLDNISLPDSLTIEEGQTAKLDVTIEPATSSQVTLFWSSNDPFVATVDEQGVVTAVAPGTTTITVTAADEEMHTATCEITVTKKDIFVQKIVLDQEEVELVEGETVELHATVQPENADNPLVTWSSTDTNVATVEDGLVTAIAPGTCMILVKATDGTDVYAACEITVTKKVILVQQIVLDQTAVELVEGNTVELHATVQPADADNQQLAWESTDTNVATVENGVVTAVAPGTCSIVVKATDGSDVSATCEITVTKKVIFVQQIVLDQTAVEIEEGNTVELHATVQPADADNQQLAWESNDTNVATVENGVVTAVAPGTCSIVVKATDGSDVSATCEITVTKKVIFVQQIVLDQTAVEIEEGNTVELHATVQPADADNQQLAWESTDTNVATVENGVVTAVAPGTCRIVVKATDGSEVSAECLFTVTPAASIASIVADQNDMVIIRPDGTVTDQLVSGVNFVRYANGTVKKIFVR